MAKITIFIVHTTTITINWLAITGKKERYFSQHRKFCGENN